jgi:hypothetical protein
MTWPLYKREELYADIQSALNAWRLEISPKLCASILGKIRSVSDLSPWGPYLSFSLSEALKQASRAAFSSTRTFWSRGKIRLSRSVIADLNLLCESLLVPEYSPIWSRYIGLLVPRIATHRFLSDASYEGIGGWSPCFQLMWRFTRADLLYFGFTLKPLHGKTGEPTSDAEGLHINPLEFIACIVNLWILLKLAQTLPALTTGYIIDLLSDNTSALSWMSYTAATRDPRLQPLARFSSALLVHTHTFLMRVQPKHIPGKINDEADALSRFQNGRFTSWEDVMQQCSHLRSCRICLPPPELLFVLADLTSSRPIAGTYVAVTTHLLTLALDFLPPGSNLRALRSSLLRPSTQSS